jgi:hypothetical protein
MRQGGPLEPGQDEPRFVASPRAFAVNETARCEGIEITLCSFVIVDELARVTGLVRVQGRPDVRLGSIPALAVSSGSGQALDPVAAHVMPHGGMAWVSWLFRHPPGTAGEYEGRIDRVDVDYRAGGRPPIPQLGPWLFRFRLANGTGPSSAPARVDRVG